MDVYFDDLTVTHELNDIVAGGDYYPFGSVMTGREITRDDYRFGYQGQFAEKDEETGWNAFEARMYDPIIGRWLSMDPSGQYASPYLGMGNNPLNGIDPDGRDWYEVDGEIVWFSVSGDFTDNAGNFYQSLGSNELVVGNHNREWTSLYEQSEAINSAYFDLYRATESITGPIATIVGNTVPADMSQYNTLAEGLYRAWFQGRNSYLRRGQDDLALLIANQDGGLAVPTTSYSPRPTATGIFLHKGNNYQESLYDSRGNAYSEGCQTTGCYAGSLQNHNAFFQRVGRNFNGNYYLRPQPRLRPFFNYIEY
jgi:RHS repeat-associated protein